MIVLLSIFNFGMFGHGLPRDQYFNYQLKSHRDIYEGYVPMEYDEYLEKISKYFLIPYVSYSFDLLDKPCFRILTFDHLGMANGVIMLHCKLLRILYVIFVVFHFADSFTVSQQFHLWLLQVNIRPALGRLFNTNLPWCSMALK